MARPRTSSSKKNPEQFQEVNNDLASLGISHRRALDIAQDVLKKLSKSEQLKLKTDVYGIFDRWKIDHGIYPPRPSISEAASALLNSTPIEKAMPFKAYIKKQMAQFGKLPRHIEPWECDRFAKTPVTLFFKLLAEDYNPLIKFIGEAQYAAILATVIVMSHNPNSDFQSDDCIEGALKLAQISIGHMRPLADEAQNRKQNAQFVKSAKKDITTKKILEAFYRLAPNGEFSPGLQKLIALEVGVNTGTVSKRLKEWGLNRASQKKVS